MSLENEGGRTPDHVAALATRQVRLPRRALLGVFGSADDPRALIRQRNGEIRTVARGDRVDGHTIVAIDSDRIALQRGGHSRMLRMPEMGTDP